jgi:mono/diheme cytochrome c family protein
VRAGLSSPSPRVAIAGQPRHNRYAHAQRRDRDPLALAVLAGGCGKSSQSTGGQPSQAQVMFDTKCAVCHGIGGAGDQIKEIILQGGANLGKSPAMPSHTLLRDRPEVLDGLVKIIRGFGKRP